MSRPFRKTVHAPAQMTKRHNAIMAEAAEVHRATMPSIAEVEARFNAAVDALAPKRDA